MPVAALAVPGWASGTRLVGDGLTSLEIMHPILGAAPLKDSRCSGKGQSSVPVDRSKVVSNVRAKLSLCLWRGLSAAGNQQRRGFPRFAKQSCHSSSGTAEAKQSCHRCLVRCSGTDGAGSLSRCSVLA